MVYGQTQTWLRHRTYVNNMQWGFYLNTKLDIPPFSVHIKWCSAEKSAVLKNKKNCDSGVNATGTHSCAQTARWPSAHWMMSPVISAKWKKWLDLFTRGRFASTWCALCMRSLAHRRHISTLCWTFEHLVSGEGMHFIGSTNIHSLYKSTKWFPMETRRCVLDSHLLN